MAASYYAYQTPTIASPGTENNIELTENHLKLLEKFDSEFRERHIKADYSGELAKHTSKWLLVAIPASLSGTSTPQKYPKPLFLQLEGIEHQTTAVRRPQSNGIEERLHCPLLDEHFRIQGRIQFYEFLDEMQEDLDDYLHIYNYERSHQGRNMNGRPPYQAFVEGIAPASQKEEIAV